jgi:hypothetical protein
MPEAARILESDAAWLKVNPGQLLMIEGHSDERGTVEYAGVGSFLPLEAEPVSRLNYLKQRGIAAPLSTFYTHSRL